MSKVELYQKWERRVAEFKTSGLSARVWSSENNISLHTLRYWVAKFSNKSGAENTARSVQWLSVEMDESTSVENGSLVIQIGKARVEVKPGCNSALLSQVLQTLVSLC